jgi:hypothetical protein
MGDLVLQLQEVRNNKFSAFEILLKKTKEFKL